MDAIRSQNTLPGPQGACMIHKNPGLWLVLLGCTLGLFALPVILPIRLYVSHKFAGDFYGRLGGFFGIALLHEPVRLV